MLTPDAAEEVLEAVKARGLLPARPQLTFESIQALAAGGAAPDVVAVKGHLERRGVLANVGGAATLTDLLGQVPTAVNVRHWIGPAAGGAGTWHGLEAEARIGQIYAQRALDLEGRHESVNRVLDEVTGVAEAATERPMSALVQPYVDRLGSREPLPGVTTGWADSDELLIRLQPGQLVTVGARPAVGKSVVLINLALHVALELEQPALLVSLHRPAATPDDAQQPVSLIVIDLAYTNPFSHEQSLERSR
ncbi:hypothetical protein DP939_25295 [Spongiactinospora rosea]|uniref:DNA 5'-3' helicase n=2 Tax=Spongiactinospora rosea TaxID=2248750 RepID=A0A366LVC0_9ACTN|nr:hypothetical protein DP939_25295 [Spongiactinospora rosea]